MSSLIIRPIVEYIVKNQRDFIVGTIGVKLALPDPVETMRSGRISLEGFRVTSSSTPRLRIGDIITHINNRSCSTPGVIETVLFSAGQTLELTILRGHSVVTVFQECVESQSESILFAG